MFFHRQVLHWYRLWHGESVTGCTHWGLPSKTVFANYLTIKRNILSKMILIPLSNPTSRVHSYSNKEFPYSEHNVISLFGEEFTQMLVKDRGNPISIKYHDFISCISCDRNTLFYLVFVIKINRRFESVFFSFAIKYPSSCSQHRDSDDYSKVSAVTSEANY